MRLLLGRSGISRRTGSVDLRIFVQVLIVDLSSSTYFFVYLNSFLDNRFHVLKVLWKIFFCLKIGTGLGLLPSSVHLVSLLLCYGCVSLIELLDSLASNSTAVSRRAVRVSTDSSGRFRRIELHVRSHFNCLSIARGVLLSSSSCIEGVIMVQRMSSLLSCWLNVNDNLG